MTKLSDLAAARSSDLRGTWYHWRGTIHVCCSRHGNPEYQREVRLAQVALADLPADASPEARVAHEEALGRALIPAAAKYLLRDWWGVDEETEPVKIDADAALIRAVAEVDGEKLEVLDYDGAQYRREGELWQRMIPYSAAAAERILAAEENYDFLNAVHGAAMLLDRRHNERAARKVGKSSSASSGTSTSPSTRSP